MSGVAVVVALLVADTAVLAAVPIAQIKAGRLPQAVALPALVVNSISAADRNILRQGDARRVTERVQVSVLAATDRDQRRILRLVRGACADRRGDLAGVTAVTVLTDSAGPDMYIDEGSIFVGSQDFRVSFNEAA